MFGFFLGSFLFGFYGFVDSYFGCCYEGFEGFWFCFVWVGFCGCFGCFVGCFVFGYIYVCWDLLEFDILFKIVELVEDLNGFD